MVPSSKRTVGTLVRTIVYGAICSTVILPPAGGITSTCTLVCGRPAASSRTKHAAVFMVLKQLCGRPLFRLRAIENQAKWFRRLFSYDDSFLEHAPSCLLDIRDACAWGHRNGNLVLSCRNMLNGKTFCSSGRACYPDGSGRIFDPQLDISNRGYVRTGGRHHLYRHVHSRADNDRHILQILIAGVDPLSADVRRATARNRDNQFIRAG